MAQVDLKHATIYLKDGYSGSGPTNPIVNKPALADPVTAPTVAVTGGGSTGGALQAGAYFVNYTNVNDKGETLVATESATFTVAAGNIPRVTLPALPTGITSRNIYLTAAGGLTGTEKLYLKGVVGTTVDLINPTVSGTASPPSSNTTGGYSIGDAVITVDTYIGIIGVGDIFRFSNADETLYQVTAHTETGPNTTSVTIAPTLQVALADNVTLTIQPHSLAIKIGEGTLNYSEKRTMTYLKDRGRLDTVREGDEQPVDVRMDFVWEFLKAVTGSGTPTIEDVLKKRGEAVDWVSSSDDPCEPYALDVIIEYDPPCSNEDREIITLPDFRWEDLAHDIKAGTVAVTGKCNAVQATIVRAA